ncbi:ribonuclease P protein component [symbiont of Argiope bruennichi]|uniref:ribonuclease P protein component n=1 Tax=symbiont of Argiope bruennichi TaxID=2810479 RepID=UPI003DA249EF
MKKKFILKKYENIKTIKNKSKKIKFNNLVVYYQKNNLKYHQFCIQLFKKNIKLSVIRNKIKRFLKDLIVNNINFKNNNQNFYFIFNIFFLNNKENNLKYKKIIIEKNFLKFKDWYYKNLNDSGSYKRKKK